MFCSVSSETDIQIVVNLASEIWTEHYTAIIGAEQVEYMLKHFHAQENIIEQIQQQNYLYFLIKSEQRMIGYFAFKMSDNELFLSKIYILSNQRGSGIGKAAFEFIKDIASNNNISKISLTVNKHNNDSIAAYAKLGFIKIGEKCVDIGQGYKMDDFVMQLDL
jgi:ribosomal protein S18 acetylase RimI-like enzyme